jgi:hypothetical protein
MQSRMLSSTKRIVMAGVCLLGATQSSAAPVVGITSGRLGAIAAAVVGLISVIIGWLAVARSNRRGAIVALVVGLIGIILSGVHLARFTGAIGTGSGRLGAIVALAVGLIGMVLGGLAMARSRAEDAARRSATSQTSRRSP